MEMDIISTNEIERGTSASGVYYTSNKPEKVNFPLFFELT